MKRQKRERPCKRCPRNKTDCNYSNCQRWIEWFAAEWNDIKDMFCGIKRGGQNEKEKNN